MESSIKTAVSLPKHLFKRAEVLAGKMNISRSRLMALALQEFVLKMENEQLLSAINGAVQDAQDEDDDRFVYVSAVQMARIAESDPDNQW